MIDFDRKLAALAKEVDGFYMRYSDDILFICASQTVLLHKVKMVIEGYAKDENLTIKDEKTNITEFYQDNATLKHRPFNPEKQASQKRFEYLGFSFDGENAFIRDKTLSGYYRKMTVGIKREAKNLVRRFKGKTPDQIKTKINFSELSQRYGKIGNFDPTLRIYKKWNFYTYAKRASDIMDEIGKTILPQLRNNHTKWRGLLELEIQKEYKKLGNN